MIGQLPSHFSSIHSFFASHLLWSPHLVILVPLMFPSSCHLFFNSWMRNDNATITSCTQFTLNFLTTFHCYTPRQNRVITEQDRTFIYSGWGCPPRGVMVKAMNCGIVVREFVLQSRYYVHFRANTLGKGMNPLILPPAMGK